MAEPLYEGRAKKYAQLLKDAGERYERRVDQLAEQMKQAGVDLRATRQRLGSALALNESQRDEPEVLVRRTPGAPVCIYHDAVDPCGRVFALVSFDRMLLSEALRRPGPRLRACSACGSQGVLAQWRRDLLARWRAEAQIERPAEPPTAPPQGEGG